MSASRRDGSSKSLGNKGHWQDLAGKHESWCGLALGMMGHVVYCVIKGQKESPIINSHEHNKRDEICDNTAQRQRPRQRSHMQLKLN